MVGESSELTLRWRPSDAAFSFDAGAFCLEILTTGGVGDFLWYETLSTPEYLSTWLAASRLGIKGIRITEDDLAAARRLRTAIFAGATARMAGRPIPRSAVAVINELAVPAPPTPRLAADRRAWTAPVTGTQALSAMARDAVDLFGGAYSGRIRECAASDCQLIFVDLSRPGQRRWCSMQRCGNRAKQRTRHGQD
jgi:predicted RNA-binding Zn ribbon-like protein